MKTDRIHVGECLIFPSHSPDEPVSSCANSAMNGPRRRQHSLTIPYYQMPAALRFAHEMHDYSVGQIKV